MIIIELIGAPRYVLDKKTISINAPGEITSSKLMKLVLEQYPKLTEIVEDMEKWNLYLLLVVNECIAHENFSIKEGDKLILTSVPHDG